MAVIGCGGVGLSMVMIGASFGARVVAVDTSAVALARAASVGAVALVDADSEPNVAAAVRAVTGGGAHVSVDAVGSPSTARESIWSLRPRGRHIQVGLLHGPEPAAGLPMARVIALELAIHGSHGMAARDYPAMIDLVASGALQPGRLIGSVIGLDEAPEALVAMDDGGAAGITVIAL
jgi:alcohol dehydrogenase